MVGPVYSHRWRHVRPTPLPTGQPPVYNIYNALCVEQPVTLSLGLKTKFFGLGLVLDVCGLVNNAARPPGS